VIDIVIDIRSIQCSRCYRIQNPQSHAEDAHFGAAIPHSSSPTTATSPICPREVGDRLIAVVVTKPSGWNVPILTARLPIFPLSLHVPRQHVKACGCSAVGAHPLLSGRHFGLATLRPDPAGSGTGQRREHWGVVSMSPALAEEVLGLGRPAMLFISNRGGRKNRVNFAGYTRHRARVAFVSLTWPE
jgi:hypothetical protein